MKNPNGEVMSNLPPFLLGSPVVYCAHTVCFLSFRCNMASRLSGQNRIEIFHDAIVPQIPEVDLSTKKTKPNIKKMTRKSRSHVKILINRTWAIFRVPRVF